MVQEDKTPISTLATNPMVHAAPIPWCVHHRAELLFGFAMLSMPPNHWWLLLSPKGPQMLDLPPVPGHGYACVCPDRSNEPDKKCRYRCLTLEFSGDCVQQQEKHFLPQDYKQILPNVVQIVFEKLDLNGFELCRRRGLCPNDFCFFY